MKHGILTVLAAVAVVPSLWAQSESDDAAHAALVATPIGAFAPLMSAPAPGSGTTHTLALRASQYSVTGLDLTAVGVTLSHSKGTLTHSITLGTQSCENCNRNWMAGLSGRMGVVSATSGSRSMGLGVNASLGYGHAKNETALSGTVGLPLSIAMDQSNKSRLSAFVSPAFGWGRASETGGSESGTRPIIGAGAGWTAPAGWGIHAGWQKVIIDGGGATAGIAFTWRHAK